MQEGETLDEYVYNAVKTMNSEVMDFGDKSAEAKSLSALPDGTYLIRGANNTHLSYKLQVNDLRYMQYHRNNGISKVVVTDPSTGYQNYILLSVEGQVSSADLLHQAYMRTLFEDTWVLSGYQYMPMQADFDSYLMRVINLLAAGIFPICLCMLLPVFIYNIVLEKEKKLIEIMKMNGLRMYNYWLINFAFNFLIYLVTLIVFMLFGAFAMGLQVFLDSNFGILVRRVFLNLNVVPNLRWLGLQSDYTRFLLLGIPQLGAECNYYWLPAFNLDHARRCYAQHDSLRSPYHGRLVSAAIPHFPFRATLLLSGHTVRLRVVYLFF